jgi:hypothetical protein
LAETKDLSACRSEKRTENELEFAHKKHNSERKERDLRTSHWLGRNDALSICWHGTPPEAGPRAKRREKANKCKKTSKSDGTNSRIYWKQRTYWPAGMKSERKITPRQAEKCAFAKHNSPNNAQERCLAAPSCSFGGAIKREQKAVPFAPQAPRSSLTALGGFP